MKKRMRREIAFVSRSPFGPRNLQICIQRARITPGRLYRPISCQLTLQRYKPLQFAGCRDTTTREKRPGRASAANREIRTRGGEGGGAESENVPRKRRRGWDRKKKKRKKEGRECGTKEPRTGGLHTRAWRNVRAHAG